MNKLPAGHMADIGFWKISRKNPEDKLSVTYERGDGAGDGSDGDLELSGSAVVYMTRDYNFNNLTIKDDAVLVHNGYHIFVKGTLDLSKAKDGAIVERLENGEGG